MIESIPNYSTLDATTLVSIDKEFETEIGDAKQPDFFPQVKVKRWGNESNFSIRFAMGAVDPVVVGNSVECENADAKAHFYEVAGGFEFGITLKNKPATNKLQFTLQHKGLRFDKVPYFFDEFGNPTETRTDELGDHFDPFHAQGSYAVYHTNKRNNQYQTGKAFHLYRPWAQDLNGKRVWCEIDITGDILTITLPPDFHQNAVYPVFVDPTLGYTTIGSGFTNSGRAWHYPHTATEDGNVTSFWYYIDSGDRDMRVAIYDDDTDFPGSPLAESSSASAGSSGPNWVENTTISLAISNGVKYWLGQHSPDSGNRAIYRDASGGQQVRAGPSVVWTSWPDPYVNSVSATYIVSMYVEYTAGGTPVSKTLTANIEALAGISAGRTFNLESLQLLQQAFTGNIEALKEIGQATPVNIESLMRVGQVIPLNLEALKGIDQTYVGGIEALKGIEHVSPVNVEALGRADQTAVINIEALGFAQITATAVIPVESLHQVTRTPEIGVEALQIINQGVTVQIESLGYIQRTGSGNIEALAFISHDATANLESLKAIAGTATLSFEALKIIAKVAQVPIEALQGATVNVIVDVVERTAYFSITLARDITFNKTVAKEATFNKTVTKNVKFH